jgi:hypothetical protein
MFRPKQLSKSALFCTQVSGLKSLIHSNEFILIRRCLSLFENQYNDEMEAEVQRLEAKGRAVDAGHPEWENACALCGCELKSRTVARCEICSLQKLQ